jgi:hypothetical protein
MNNTNSKLFIEHSIIPPPSIKSRVKQKTDCFKVIIDSRDRDVSLYTEPSKYTIKLDEPINDVVAIQLTDYNIPFSRTLINSTNKILKYSINNMDTTKTVILTEGIYSGSELATELNAKLTPDISSVTYDTKTGKITFTAVDGNFVLIFSSSINDKNNLYSILGFSIGNYSSSSSTAVIAPYTVNLDTDNYIIMKLDNAITNISNNDTINKSFAIIKNTILSDEFIKKDFNPPMNNFSKFIIEFNDYYGNLYQFNGKEHRLEFIIETLSKTENIFK